MPDSFFSQWRLKAWELAVSQHHSSVCHITWHVSNFISCVSWYELSLSADSPAARPSPSQSSSQPARQIRQTDSWWQTPRASARGRWWCSTWRQCCVSPTRGESPRRGHGVYSRCCWLVQKLQSRQSGEVSKEYSGSQKQQGHTKNNSPVKNAL